MNSRKPFFTVPVLLLTLVFSGFAVAGDNLPENVQRACRSCHGLKTVCLKLGKQTLSGWKLTVRNMVARGAHVTTSNVEPVAEYLAGLEPGDPAICD